MNTRIPMSTQGKKRTTSTRTPASMALTNTSIATMPHNRTVTGVEDFPPFTQKLSRN